MSDLISPQDHRPVAVIEPGSAPAGAPHGSFDDAALPLLRELVDAPYGSRHRLAARAELVERYMPLAEAVAQRFTGPGRSATDVTQAAAIALVAAIDRAGPAFAGRMTSYLVTAVAGELLTHGEEPVADVVRTATVSPVPALREGVPT